MLTGKDAIGGLGSCSTFVSSSVRNDLGILGVSEELVVY